MINLMMEPDPKYRPSIDDILLHHKLETIYNSRVIKFSQKTPFNIKLE